MNDKVEEYFKIFLSSTENFQKMLSWFYIESGVFAILKVKFHEFQVEILLLLTE